MTKIANFNSFLTTGTIIVCSLHLLICCANNVFVLKANNAFCHRCWVNCKRPGKNKLCWHEIATLINFPWIKSLKERFE